MSEHELKPDGWPAMLHRDASEVNIAEVLPASTLIENIERARFLHETIEKSRTKEALSPEDAEALEKAMAVAAQEEAKDEYAWLEECAWPDKEPVHQHHFKYLLNANHTALRGCSCGLAFVGHMVGSVDNLVWHRVHEEEE